MSFFQSIPYYQDSVNESQQLSDRDFKHNPDMKTLKQRLIEERTDKGWSQTELAHRAHIPQSFIGALEAKNQESSKYLPEIARALGVDAYWLKTGFGNRTGGSVPLDADQEMIITAFPHFSDDLKEIILNAARKALDKQKEAKNKVA